MRGASADRQICGSSWDQEWRKEFREKKMEAAVIAWVGILSSSRVLCFCGCASKGYPEENFPSTCSNAGNAEPDLLLSLYHQPRQTVNTSFLMNGDFLALCKFDEEFQHI